MVRLYSLTVATVLWRYLLWLEERFTVRFTVRTAQLPSCPAAQLPSPSPQPAPSPS